MAAEALAAEIQRVLSTAVDAEFYLIAYPDVAEAELSAFEHYSTLGWREGRDAACWFSAERYLALNPDVKASGVEPLSHYITVGRHEGRQIAPSRHARRYFERVGELDRKERETAAIAHVWSQLRIIEDEFDADWYLATYPDVAETGTNPIWHFDRLGWHEGRDPNRWFSVRDYLELHPDVAAAQINPFIHYVASGRGEGRQLRLDLGFRYPLIATAVPPTKRLANAISISEWTETSRIDELTQALRTAPAGLADLHITFSHDDYTQSLGGMQLCLRRESREFAVRGIDHLHIHPVTPWPMARADSQPGVVGVVLNGQRLGTYAACDVIWAARQIARGRARGRRSFAIHSLLGHSPADVVELLSVFELKAGFFWLHDFASLCAGYHLLRNDVEDCAGPPIESPACNICSYGPLRAAQIGAHDSLFRQLELTVVSPSETTLAFWQARAAFQARNSVVLPHAQLVPTASSPSTGASRRALRVAFLGMAHTHKGWPIFADLAERFAGDRRYRFMQLGGRPDPRSSIEFHKAVGSETRPDAMREALAAQEVDVAFIWPLCRETFSFTAYEAVAAGCAILTWPDSGNVAAFVAESGHGRVLADEAELRQLFDSGEVRELSRAHRGSQTFDLRYSRMTADLMPEETLA